MGKRSPNAEQVQAIEHTGGVLLRAGAGSGKTFVLVEHIVYLTQKWISEFKKQPSGSFEEFIREKFSQVVMMTFTKKAAGEMSIRLNEKFTEVSSQTDEDKESWKIANDALPLLMVTTIDGFCLKLITSGYFPHLSTESKIIFTPERKDQVGDLLQSWFQTCSQNVPQDMLEIVIREKEVLLSAFSNIFNDPGLRLAWKNFSLKDTRPEILGKVISLSYQLNDISSALGQILGLDLPHETERSAFEKFIGEMQSTGLPEVDSVDKLKIYFQLLETKRLDGEKTAKKKSPAHDAALLGLKTLKPWVVKWTPEILDYIQHYDQKILPWMRLCKELFDWIEKGLDPNQGMTFGDVEYFVASGLDNKDDRSRIQKTFNYFIVDEFQDTSALQFKIIQSLIGNDYSKLFCVGDAKQAIYGFRGGELSVFQDCAELMPSVKSLANNYRSLPEIIHFNNSLFKAILPLGQGFEGHDLFTVNPEDQNVPAEVPVSEKGEIEILSVVLERDLETDGKFKNEDINRVEAYLLAESIALERSQKPQEVCTILYSKLKPSAELIRFLMDKGIGFTAQFKIDLMDDPIIGMFLCLLKRKFDANPLTKDRYPLFIIENYLHVLKVKFNLTAQDLAVFDQNVSYWGLLEGFRKFIHHLGFTNENSDINMKAIETISDLHHQDPEAVMVQVSNSDNDRISMDLRSGENSHMVQIMTAHASKGLEFDTVYFAGIYTNGKDANDGPLFGDMPGSFKWFLDLSQRDKRKSPFYLYEDELTKYKSFSESKRLFYVVSTRAKKKLVWVHLQIPEKSFSVPKNSWIDGLNHWFDSGLDENCVQSVHVKEIKDFDSKALLHSQSLPQLPLFFHDPVGVFNKGEGVSELSLVAELSVTRLNSLIDCPRKFYFENILKLKGKEKEFKPQEVVEEENEEIASVIRSSSERGTHIHAQIAQGIERNFIVPRESFSTELQAPIEWVLNILKDLKSDYEMVSEKSLKFKFFNFMISGIPDLILMPRSNQKAQVWDFKTGRITKENLGHYWVQLKVYAYALYELGRIPASSEIELKLVFADEKQVLSEIVTRQQCEKDLFPLWRSQNEPWKINSEHCAQCPYGDICPR